jgi:hypothetical protein
VPKRHGRCLDLWASMAVSLESAFIALGRRRQPGARAHVLSGKEDARRAALASAKSPFPTDEFTPPSRNPLRADYRSSVATKTAACERSEGAKKELARGQRWPVATIATMYRHRAAIQFSLARPDAREDCHAN